MLFDFTDDQVSFARSLEAVLAPAASPQRLREAWESRAGDRALWQQLADVGLVGLLVEQSAGGVGASVVEAALPLEQIGYHAAAVPALDNVIVLPMLLAGRDDAAATNWLSRVAGGDATVSQVLGPSGLATFALDAEAFLVVEGDVVHLVPRQEAAVTPVPSTDPSLGIAKVETVTSARTEVARGEAAVSLLHASSATAASLLLVGIAQHLLDLTCRHVLDRRQFRQPIGAFQAVKHRLADVAVQLEAARSLSWYAAYAASYRPDELPGAASRAKAAASEAAGAAGRAALQLHGGIGFTWEHDLHLYLQRARALEALYGTASEHRAAVGRSYLDAVRGSRTNDQEEAGARGV